MCAKTWQCQCIYLCFIWSGASISTKVGLFFAASLPPALSSGKPGRFLSWNNTLVQSFIAFGLDYIPSYITFHRRSSMSTLHTSLYLVTSHAWLPSHSSTLVTGSVARSRAYSTGGSATLGREKGNFGGCCANVAVSIRHLKLDRHSLVTDNILLWSAWVLFDKNLGRDEGRSVFQ
jgi:hypothetical protein